MKQRPSWWKTGVIYQIYPRSFADSDGDGVGDLRGIISKLDYLEWLGVDAVWLSPFYPSPMKDFGYDVSDYRDVDPVFGTLPDFDELVEEAHRRGILMIVDFVPNHTSDEHEWFIESRSSRENPKRDWYIWRDAKEDGSPPNNWQSIHSSESAWEFDEETRQYYLHMFQPEQPDLNWRNPEVREAMHAVMRFWMERGVDGFRIDALPHMAKDALFRDDLPNPDWREGKPPSGRLRRLYSEDRPEILDWVRGMRRVADEYEGRALIGEIYRPLPRLMEYYGENLDGVHMPYNFGLVLLEEWKPEEIGAVIEEYEAALPEGAAPNWVLGNHDNPRIASRMDRPRLAHMLLLTLRGSPTIYYGDEIGMRDGDIPPEMAKDPQSESNPDHNRDPERTPMQWNTGKNAGFCPEGADPWLPVADDYEEANVEGERRDPHSMLALVRRLVKLRRETPALTDGSYRSLDAGSRPVLAYVREHEEGRVLVALNFGSEQETLDFSRLGGEGEVLCSTSLDRGGRVPLEKIEVRPGEGIMVSLGP